MFNAVEVDAVEGVEIGANADTEEEEETAAAKATTADVKKVFMVVVMMMVMIQDVTVGYLDL
jgi:hypothetical protein